MNEITKQDVALAKANFAAIKLHSTREQYDFSQWAVLNAEELFTYIAQLEERVKVLEELCCHYVPNFKQEALAGGKDGV
jgi:hypothetical protein